MRNRRKLVFVYIKEGNEINKRGEIYRNENSLYQAHV